MRGNAHVRFGRRAGETDLPQGRHRAPVRPDHTHASLLLASGTNPKIVSERLGHHSVAFTLDTCAHVLPGMQSAAAQALSDALFRDDEDDHDDTDRDPRGFFQ